MGNVTMFCSLLTETQISPLAAKALPISSVFEELSRMLE
jgi:hypothetical protein